MAHIRSFVAAWVLVVAVVGFGAGAWGGNPIITDVFTADPAAMVQGDTVYLYVGQDEAPPNTHYRMNRWLCYSSKDMRTWTAHGSPLAVKDFAWASRDAYAAHVVEKGGKFYWYVSIEHNASKPGKAIGVAVADSPTGPFKDARGSALVTADMTTKGKHGWEDIDPAVFTDDDGTSYLFWGNVNCYYAKLKPNMVELDGEIRSVDVPRFTEAPWVHKRGDVYYLSYATGFPEKIAYATAPKVTGPWTYRGLLAEVAGNSNTIHQAIVEHKGQWYFFYHNGALPGGDSYRRAVCVDYLYYNADGTMRRVVQTTEGTDLPAAAGDAAGDSARAATPGVVVPRWQWIRCYGDGGLYVRHADSKGRVSAYPSWPHEDTMWRVVPGLADGKGVSFEALLFPGYFLRRKGADVLLEKGDGSGEFGRDATFTREAGLADAGWVSFRAGDGGYLKHEEGVLRVGRVSSQGEKERATFRVVYEGGEGE